MVDPVVRHNGHPRRTRSLVITTTLGRFPRRRTEVTTPVTTIPCVMSSDHPSTQFFFDTNIYPRISQRTCSAYAHHHTHHSRLHCILQHTCHDTSQSSIHTPIKSHGGVLEPMRTVPQRTKPHCVLSYNGPHTARSCQHPTSSHTTRSGQCPPPGCTPSDRANAAAGNAFPFSPPPSSPPPPRQRRIANAAASALLALQRGMPQ